MPRILVVDDLTSDRRIAGGLLSKDENISVEYASNGVNALEQIDLHLPDLVVTDLQMPEMDGLELVRKMREAYPLIPTILMTAKGSERIAVQALQQGAASYVPKKHLAGNLLDTVHRVLASAAGHRSLSRLMNCVTETKFVLENDLSLISSLVSHLRQDIQHRLNCDRNESIRIANGLDEALTNAYYHGNLEVDSALKADGDNRFRELAARRLRESPYADRQIFVTARYSVADVTVVIRDEGPGFNPDNLPDPTEPEYLDRPSGRGLLLMRCFMDEVTYNDVGNEVTLVKRRSQSTAGGTADRQ